MLVAMEAAERLTARELARLWQIGVLGRLQLELNPTTFNQWLKGTSATSFEHGELRVEARTAMTCDFLDRRMRVVIERAVASVFENAAKVTFVPPGMPDEAEPPRELPDNPPNSAANQNPRPPIGEFNPAHTFAEYLPGRGNTLAIEACRSLIQPSDLSAGGVLLYGNPGLGKTHLLHALAGEAHRSGLRVACLTAEDFTNRWMRCLRGDGAIDDFRDGLRAADLLILDDLQLLPRKEGVQNELMATIDAVLNRGGKIAMASERHPFELQLLERLESRIGEGLITEVRPFESAERRLFVEWAARRQRVALPGWALDRIASAGVTSARLMLGFVKAAAGLELVKDLTPGRLDESLSVVALQAKCAEAGEKQLIERIAQQFDVTPADLAGKSRARAIATARAIAALALVERGYSLQQAGAVLGGRDKSTLHDLVARGRKLDESGEVRRRAAG